MMPFVLWTSFDPSPSQQTDINQLAFNLSRMFGTDPEYVEMHDHQMAPVVYLRGGNYHLGVTTYTEEQLAAEFGPSQEISFLSSVNDPNAIANDVKYMVLNWPPELSHAHIAFRSDDSERMCLLLVEQ
jgi:hypothetical protein